MKTLQEKLKLVPSPIREMIEEEIRISPTGVNPCWCAVLYESFSFIRSFDFDFWDAVHYDLEYHVKQFNKKKK